MKIVIIVLVLVGIIGIAAKYAAPVILCSSPAAGKVLEFCKPPSPVTQAR